jgi:molybdopterin-guanine dinucleotide biosynthesis protein A
MFDLPCVIFAGGKSSRMGTDKALLSFGSSDSLIHYQYERLNRLFASTYISVKTADKIPFSASIIEDHPGSAVFAPTAGFVAVFEQLEAKRIFVLSVDTPFVNADIIRRLLEADRDDLDAVIARTPTGSHPMCGIYHRTLLPEFQAMLTSGNHRLGMLLKKNRTRHVDFDDETAFSNLNHPHEYKAALTALKSMSDTVSNGRG